MNNINRFVILAAPRTGSNLLCTLLQSHTDVLCHHEIFNPEGIFTALPLRNTDFNLGSMVRRETHPLSFLERVWENRLGHQLVGFKMTHRQQAQVFDAVCSDPNIHKIVLQREARLKTYVSGLLAERSGTWEDYRTSDSTSPPPLPVDVDYLRLQAAIDFNEQYYASLDNMICGPRTDLIYETLFDVDTQQKLLKALNLSSQTLKAQSRRQNPQLPGELISNSDSLAEQLSHNPADKKLLMELNDSRTPLRDSP